MANISTQLIKDGIECYTGGDRVVVRVELSHDPVVDGTVAIRSNFADGDQLDFLLVDAHVLRTKQDVAEALQEAMFEHWPPTSGRIRFY